MYANLLSQVDYIMYVLAKFDMNTLVFADCNELRGFVD